VLRWLRNNKREALAAEGPRPLESERLYVVGDVHGRVDLLKRIIELIIDDLRLVGGDDREPILVFVGDVIDRGDCSREVIDLLIELKRLWTFGRVIVLKGNHEAALLQFLDNPRKGATWLGFGGLQTVTSYGLTPPPKDADSLALSDLAVQLTGAMGDHLDFVRNLSLTFRSGNVVCAHAGIDPENPVAENEDTLLWGNSAFLLHDIPPGHFVVHGHYDAPEVFFGLGRICVDTGAYYSGHLSAVRLDNQVSILSTE